MAVGKTTRCLVVLVVVLSTIGCDRVTKDLAGRYLAGRPGLSMAAGSVRLEYVENRGGFLSLGAQLPDALRTGIFSFGTALLLACLGVFMVRRVLAGGWAVGPALLWAGGVGNLVDRIAHGSVVDFLNVGVGALRTGVFNAADMAITAGVVLIALDLGRSRSSPAPQGPIPLPMDVHS